MVPEHFSYWTVCRFPKWSQSTFLTEVVPEHLSYWLVGFRSGARALFLLDGMPATPTSGGMPAPALECHCSSSSNTRDYSLQCSPHRVNLANCSGLFLSERNRFCLFVKQGRSHRIQAGDTASGTRRQALARWWNGRHTGFKILRGVSLVRVRVPP